MENNHIYFVTLHGIVLTANDICEIAKIVDGKSISTTDYEAIKKYASNLKGIKSELNINNVEDLAKISKTKAIILYRELNKVSLKESADAIDEMLKSN